MEVNKYFAELDTFGTSASAMPDPIMEWLSTPPVLSAKDPIAWWTTMKAASNQLAQLGLDFLSAPGLFYCFFHK